MATPLIFTQSFFFSLLWLILSKTLRVLGVCFRPVIDGPIRRKKTEAKRRKRNKE